MNLRKRIRGVPGRPKAQINWAKFAKLCEWQCSLEEVAAHLELSSDTIERAVVERFGKGFAEVFRQKRRKGNISLRRKQYQIAMAGDRTMLIWLGKQYLGQRNKWDHSGPGDRAIPVSLEGAQAALSDLIDEVTMRLSSEEKQVP